MSNTPEEIIARLRELQPVNVEGADGFTCFRQMTIETSGLEPDTTEDWLLANGGHLKHVRIPDPDNIGRRIPNPDSEPVYFIPDSLLG
jgi:hypothetical protein